MFCSFLPGLCRQGLEPALRELALLQPFRAVRSAHQNLHCHRFTPMITTLVPAGITALSELAWKISFLRVSHLTDVLLRR